MSRKNDAMLPGSTLPTARILCQRTDGIGCRLLTLLWTLRLARKADAGVVLFWPSLELFYHGTVAGDLFDLVRLARSSLQDRLQIIDGDCREYFRPRPIILHRRNRHEPRDLVVQLDAGPQRKALPVIVGSWEGPMLAPGEDADSVMAEMPSLFAELPFRADLLVHVDRIARRAKLSKAVAVHVRRGEIVRNLRTAVSDFRLGDQASEDLLDERARTFVRRCMSVEDLADALRVFVNKGRHVVVFSDEPDAHEALSNALGASAVVAASSLIDAGLTPIQQAFVEAVLMSRCACIVGATSAFSEFAHVIGGHARVLLRWRHRSQDDCSALMFASVSDQIGSHPEKLQIEQRLRDRVARLLA